MDNRVIDVRSEGRQSFDLAIQLLFTEKHSERKATHYIDDPEHGLIFLWTASPKAIKLPIQMDWKHAADMAWAWLAEQPTDKYKEYCDHDGSDGKGFRVYTEDWGHVAGMWEAICAIQPIWAWYGK